MALYIKGRRVEESEIVSIRDVTDRGSRLMALAERRDVEIWLRSGKRLVQSLSYNDVRKLARAVPDLVIKDYLR